MEKFILTVLRDNVLDSCELFESQGDALASAVYFCEMANIEVNRSPTYDDKMKGWLVSDSYGYFVSVVKRNAHSASYMIGSSYGTFLDSLAGRGFARRGGGYGAIPDWQREMGPSLNLNMRILDGYYSSMHESPSKWVEPIATAPVAPPAPLPTLIQAPAPTPLPIYAPGDDPNDDCLPGGFSTLDKPIDMATLKNDPHYVKSVYQLSDEQKWALVLARTKHRPKQVILINSPGCSVKGCWSQHHMLQELTKRTPLGLEMRDQELKELDVSHAIALDAYDDESSSSSDEEDSEY